jgi:lysophospholipid acyltransferase (LPLAT)-like uncharacterized protein
MLKSTLKKFLKSDDFHCFIAWLASYYIRFVILTGSMHSHLPPNSMPYFNNEHPAIFALWHSRIMLIQSLDPYHIKRGGRRMHALVSKHRDGRMIGRVLSHFGIKIIHGSTSKGGAAALRALVQDFRAGHNLAITPDGPRGPERHASEGVAQLAMLTRAPIICVGYSATRHRRLRSWDKFMVALPFSALHFVASEPFFYQPTKEKFKDREKLRLQIEQELNRVTDEADRLAELR